MTKTVSIEDFQVDVTPSGVAVAYRAEPRQYLIADTFHEGHADFKEVPSVTEVLDVLNKGGLTYWGMQVGVRGCMRLMEENIDIANLSEAEIIAELKRSKLTVNDVRDKAAGRGRNVHDGLEAWGEDGVVPDPMFYAEEEEGYVKGLASFLRDVKPEALGTEIMVGHPGLRGSESSGFAGRFDLLCNIREGSSAVIKMYPKRPSIVDRLPAGLWIIDMKTSKGVYPSHHIQIAAYELAARYCGYIDNTTVVHHGILHVTADGRYELVRGQGRGTDFIAVREVWQVVKDVTKRK